MLIVAATARVSEVVSRELPRDDGSKVLQTLVRFRIPQQVRTNRETKWQNVFGEAVAYDRLAEIWAERVQAEDMIEVSGTVEVRAYVSKRTEQPGATLEFRGLGGFGSPELHKVFGPFEPRPAAPADEEIDLDTVPF